ncbi:MAG: 2-amino-4-hydroxy-6-hydroxymethyldihydropteridine diphosphokinase [Halobacteriovoraceae bacterium]|nr:2-amino-4-hydroxy-6-hydroxymethyldihydropteridine diphosphokinase [Halobacteriovoraceae bacterium]
MTTLVFATGSNLGDSVSYLKFAKTSLSKYFTFDYESQIYLSQAVDYLNQPDFYNQVLQFSDFNSYDPYKILKIIQSIEDENSRERIIDKGPRTLDIDFLFMEDKIINTENLQIPHPEFLKRSFVVRPLMELPFYEKIKGKYDFPSHFKIEASPIQ